MSNCVFVWDAEGLPPDSHWTVVLWRSFAESTCQSVVSIPKLVEDNADVLKARYLAWIYDLGERLIDGKRLIDHLELRPGFSYWWMTEIAQKFTCASSHHITDAIRLMAFDDWATEHTLSRVVLTSSNKPLAECMQLLCTRLGLEFDWRRRPRRPAYFSLVRRAYKVLPLALQTIAYLIFYFVDRWPLRGAGLKKWRQTNGQVTFFSYFFNLVPNATNEGCFESRYWANLPEVLQKNGCKTNWLHIYLKDPLHPTAGIAAQKIDQFNSTDSGEQVHVALDSFLSVRVGLKALRDWFRLVWAGRKLEPEISKLFLLIYQLEHTHLQ